MSSTAVSLEIGGALARIAMSRPECRNAFDESAHRAFAAALDRIEATEGLRALLLTGAGGAFCAGQDLAERGEMLARDPDLDLGRLLARNFGAHVRRLAALPMPVVAAVDGAAAGAGIGLALAADLVLASSRAQFAFSFAKVGLVPDAGLTWTLPRRVGAARAHAWCLEGVTVDVRTALGCGLVDAVLPVEGFDDAVRARAAALAAGPTLAFALAKRAFAETGGDFEGQLATEAALQTEAGRSRDYRAAVAAFLARRAPDFEGR